VARRDTGLQCQARFGFGSRAGPLGKPADQAAQQVAKIIL